MLVSARHKEKFGKGIKGILKCRKLVSSTSENIRILFFKGRENIRMVWYILTH